MRSNGSVETPCYDQALISSPPPHAPAGGVPLGCVRVCVAAPAREAGPSGRAVGPIGHWVGSKFLVSTK